MAATAGQIVTYAGKPAITYFFASSGGTHRERPVRLPGSEPEPWLQAVADPYEGSATHWKYTLSSATAGARLAGLFKGSLRGIEVLRRGASPRIVLAEVLGTRASTRVSGATLEYRLGLPSTWAYFGLRNGTTTTAEPDLSGHPESGSGSTGAPSTPPAPSFLRPHPRHTTGGSEGPAAPTQGTGGTSAG